MVILKKNKNLHQSEETVEKKWNINWMLRVLLLYFIYFTNNTKMLEGKLAFKV